MATLQECEAALDRLAERLSGVDADVRRRHSFDRSISCRIPDLERSFSGRLRAGTLDDLVHEPLPNAQIRLTVKSDDLVALTEGRLPLAAAWASGRLKIEASVLDLLRLRSLI